MNHSAEFRRCLEECDVVAIRDLWRHVSPNLHQPSSDQEALATIHYARTQAEWASMKMRLYSHDWLVDHGLPSGLPDDMRPKRERIYPHIVEGVGVSINFASSILREASVLVEQSISNAINDMYADVKSVDPIVVKQRIDEVRKNTMKKLFGR